MEKWHKVLNAASLDGVYTLSVLYEDTELLDLVVIISERNELKHACEVHTDLASLSEAPCSFGKLNQVLTNLTINALQAMDGPGGLHITSHAMVDCIEFEIGDDAPGVRDDIRQDIFSPFFTTKPVGQGTGLGLSIGHAIFVDDLGGSLQLLSSGREQGANFLITLPITPQ